MTEPISGDAPTESPEPESDVVARARALKAKRAATTTGRAPASGTGARVLVAGVAASAAILMVGTMAVAARSSPASAPQVIDRVIVIEMSVANADETTAPREVRVLTPAPVASAEPMALSSGS